MLGVSCLERAAEGERDAGNKPRLVGGHHADVTFVGWYSGLIREPAVSLGAGVPAALPKRIECRMSFRSRFARLLVGAMGTNRITAAALAHADCFPSESRREITASAQLIAFREILSSVHALSVSEASTPCKAIPISH